MLDSNFLFIIIGIPAYLILLFILFKKKKKTSEIILNSIFLVYILGVIAVTIFPLPIQKLLIEHERELDYLRNNWVPLRSIIEISTQMPSYVIYRQIGGNLALLLPLGFLAPLIWPRLRHFWKALGVGFLCSLAIELTQLLISTILGYTYKIFDIDDLILNTLGVALGYGLFTLYQFGIKTEEEA